MLDVHKIVEKLFNEAMNVERKPIKELIEKVPDEFVEESVLRSLLNTQDNELGREIQGYFSKLYKEGALNVFLFSL